MYSIIQIIAIVIFIVSFFVPLMWIWGQIVGIVLFLWASVAARRDKRLKNIERELQKKQA
jgi:Flp pilus assembly protein TadB